MIDGERPSPHEVRQVGERLVAAQIRRRGGIAEIVGGRRSEIAATDEGKERQILIRVKTRRSGSWHAQVSRDAVRRTPVAEETTFLVFVDIGGDEPEYYVVPEWWIQNDIHEVHSEYLARHGGRRKVNPDSDHHAVTHPRLEQWRERWDLLGILSHPG